jgi:RNA polymerase sigma-70 factor (ECF subfamily)
VGSRDGNFDDLYERFAPLARDAAHRILDDHAAAEDVAHDVLLSLWVRPQRFDASRGSLETFVRMNARSRALDVWRSRGARTRAVDRLRAHEGSAVGHDTAAIVAARESSASLLTSMSQLPPDQRQAVLLMYGRGLTADEIARAIDTPLGTVKSRVRLGRHKLREAIDPADSRRVAHRSPA